MSSTSNASCQPAPRRRASPSGISLTSQDASIVKGMLARGDAQHSIAAYFGVNSGRVAEIATGERFADAPHAPDEDLPPPGPYLTPCSAAAAAEALRQARDALDRAEQLIASQTH